MSEILSLSLRPRGFSQLVGQRRVTEAIQAQAGRRMPRAWMFFGSTGTGKTTLARILALSYQCRHTKTWGEPCEQCWAHWNNFGIQEINASDLNGVEDMGKVAETARYRPIPPARTRVIILDEAQRVTSAAQNLLLKSFEDTPRTTVWVICTTEPAKILPTLRRRCMSYQLKPLGHEARELLLKRAAKTVKFTKPLGDLVSECNEAQIGSPALLLMALEKYMAGMSVREAVAGVDGGAFDTLPVCRALILGKWLECRKALQEASADDARWIRASVCGYLRGCLVRENNVKRQVALADSLRELASGTAPLEDSLMLHWLWGSLCRVCGRMRG